MSQKVMQVVFLVHKSFYSKNHIIDTLNVLWLEPILTHFQTRPFADFNNLGQVLLYIMTVFTWQQDEETKIDVCVEDEMIVYLNRKDVQTALHARLVVVKNWTPCREEYMNPTSCSSLSI
ncbi:putative peptidase S10, serine carboxypeptidase [Helianthus annuus]|nr:putative peptidase S10, serine carboxypeptidase [Helianthus annuus]